MPQDPWDWYIYLHFTIKNQPCLYGMGVELRILSVISFPKLRKTDLFAATFRLKSLKLLRGTICPLRTTETVLQKKAPLRILGKKSEVQTGSNAMNILIRLSEIFVATTKHLTNVRLL